MVPLVQILHAIAYVLLLIAKGIEKEKAISSSESLFGISKSVLRKHL
ncbi:hypothetical protein [Halobacillus trueperi]